MRIHCKPGGGEAFAEFASPVEGAQAMNLHKQNMGHRYIELKLVMLLFLCGSRNLGTSFVIYNHTYQIIRAGRLQLYGVNRRASRCRPNVESFQRSNQS